MPTAPSVEFDVRAIPFSTRGAWLDISPVVGLHQYADDLHLVSHRHRLTSLLRLRPFRSGTTRPTTIRASSSTLSWSTAGGHVEAVFDGPDRVRLRGDSLGMRFECPVEELTPFSGSYLYRDPATGGLTFTSYETGSRCRVTVLHGSSESEGEEALGRAPRSITVGGDGAGWEVVIEEFPTARLPVRVESTFEEAVGSARFAFSAYLDRVAPWRSEETPAAVLAAYVLWSATVEPEGFLGRESVLMSMHWMDKVWSWDHCFNALALAEGEPARALDQFLVPFDHQTAEGALPDSVAHSELLYNYVKPPIHGWTFSRMRPLLGPVGPEILEEVRARLQAWTEFWLRFRRAPGHELAYYQHGNDSGWDNATAFDHARVTESPDLAAFLVLQMETLADLEAELGDVLRAADWRARAQAMLEALMTLWDGQAFVTRSVGSAEAGASSSLLTLLPLILGDRLKPEVREALLEHLQEHLTPWGPATEPPSSPRYEPDGYWRGPIWAPSTALIEAGLRDAGESALADQVSASYRRLCETHGFAENFDALSGAGLRDRAYTWTAAVYLQLAAAAVRRDQPVTSTSTRSIR